MFEMWDLWELFVINIFGSFWLAIFGLAAIMAIIFAFGGISAYSNGTFIGIFLLAMLVGYGQPFIPLFVFLGICFYTASQIVKYVNHT